MVGSRIGIRRALLAVLAAVACVCAAPAAALGAVGDLTFDGCIGIDEGCTATNPATALNGADSVAMSADGSSVYVTANSGANGGILTGLIDEFSRNTSTGVLTFQGCLGDGAGSPCTETNPADALGEPESVAVSADGKNVYVAATFEGVIDVFSRSSTGALAFAECIGSEVGPCTPTGPADALGGAESVALSADGTSVYVGSEDSLDMFSREPSTGALTYKSCIGEDKRLHATTPADAVVGITIGGGEPRRQQRIRRQRRIWCDRRVLARSFDGRADLRELHRERHWLGMHIEDPEWRTRGCKVAGGERRRHQRV